MSPVRVRPSAPLSCFVAPLLGAPLYLRGAPCRAVRSRVGVCRCWSGEALRPGDAAYRAPRGFPEWVRVHGIRAQRNTSHSSLRRTRAFRSRRPRPSSRRRGHTTVPHVAPALRVGEAWAGHARHSGACGFSAHDLVQRHVVHLHDPAGASIRRWNPLHCRGCCLLAHSRASPRRGIVPCTQVSGRRCGGTCRRRWTVVLPLRGERHQPADRSHPAPAPGCNVSRQARVPDRRRCGTPESRPAALRSWSVDRRE